MELNYTKYNKYYIFYNKFDDNLYENKIKFPLKNRNCQQYTDIIRANDLQNQYLNYHNKRNIDYIQEIHVLNSSIMNKEIINKKDYHYGKIYNYYDDNNKIINEFQYNPKFINNYKYDLEIKPYYIIKEHIKNNTLDNSIINKYKISNIVYEFIKYHSNLFNDYLKNIYYPKIINENKNKFTNIINKDNIYNHINEKLGDTFIDLLKKTNSVISGSFVLSFVFNRFKYDDIDIYIPYKCEYDFIRYLKPYIKKYKSQRMETFSYNMNNIRRIYTIILKNDIKIQLILLYEKDPIDFIDENFDFDFCKIVFDGHNIKYLNKINNTITDAYMSKCFDNTDRYSIYRIAKTLERIDKYIKRGFTINNINEFINLIKKNNNTK